MSDKQDGADLLVRAMRQAFKDTFEQKQPPKDDRAPSPVEKQGPLLDNRQQTTDRQESLRA